MRVRIIRHLSGVLITTEPTVWSGRQLLSWVMIYIFLPAGGIICNNLCCNSKVESGEKLLSFGEITRPGPKLKAQKALSVLCCDWDGGVINFHSVS